MSDAHLTTPADNTAPVHLLTDAQVGDVIATKFLNEMRTAMTPAKESYTQISALSDASEELHSLNGDPQQKAVLEAIANKIESHSSVLGLVDGTVERDKSGNITSFTFSDPQQHDLFTRQLNAEMETGKTLTQATAALLVSNPLPATSLGTVHMDANQ